MQDVGLALITAGVCVGVIALLTLHLLPTGISPIGSAVSQYGITKYRFGYRVQTIAYGLAGAGAAVGIAALPGPTAFLVFLCGLFAVTRLAISWFPMDAPGGGRTKTGLGHFLLATTAFVAVGVAARQLSKLLDHDKLDPGAATASSALAFLILLTLVGMAMNRRTRGKYGGLIERIFYLCMTVWLVIVAIVLGGQA